MEIRKLDQLLGQVSDDPPKQCNCHQSFEQFQESWRINFFVVENFNCFVQVREPDNESDVEPEN